MEKKLTTPKGRLKWFLDFISAKIDKLSDREVFNLWIELREIAYGDLGVLAIRDVDLIKWNEKRNEAQQLQGYLKGLLEKILAVSKEPKKHMIRPISAEREMEIADKNIDGQVDDDEISGFHNVLGDIISSDAQGKNMSEWAATYVADSLNLKVKILANDESVVAFFTRLQDKLILEFCSLLGHFPLSYILKCQRVDCGAYFLKATKKEKHYCSNKCAWVMASRERRKVQPEEERSKKRESYYKKVRIDHPKARIQKRTRKEK
jgi:hypothetical protein